ncbi:hypothetical protein VKT23_012396 [Stygiomarasmius scandens]|uniref:Cytochrome P450 n=1 Tax=Marasmiellus scandens TaxID=2682957 RepID=A0ABR1J8K9_9AGAR
MWKVTAFLAVIVTLYFRFHRTGTRYPPGPRGLPILGNVFQLSTVKPWHIFTKWKKTYGPMVYLNVLGQPMIILNSKKIAEDLLERRAARYSWRPELVVLKEMTGEMGIAFIRDNSNERWRKMRRTSENALGIRTASNYHRVQSVEGILLAYGILRQPQRWKSQIERASSSISLSMIYDHPPIQSLEDPSVIFMNEVVEKMGNAALPGAHLVEIFPCLRHLPRFLSKWRRDAEKTYVKFNSKYEEMFLKVKNEFLNGQEQRHSFCLNLVENQTNHKLSDSELAWLAGILYGAGYETTGTTMMWFIFCMILFPRVQQRAQDELDKVVGQSRLPLFSDLKHLPYIRAIVKEVLRWRPALPLSVPHVAAEDDYYNGYFIAKGTIMIPNVWSINRDTEVYGMDAEDFRPERHLNADGDLVDENSEGHSTYGFGYRHCAGRHVANNSLFIQMATILWAMRLEGVKGENGNTVEPDLNAEDETGVFTRPPPFGIVAIPRFKDADALIQHSRDEVMEEFSARLDMTQKLL